MSTHATELGFQHKVELRDFTLGELLAMKTATTNEQTPINLKRADTLLTDLSCNGQIEPFSVVEFDAELYLSGGRHRANCQQRLNRPMNTLFTCLFYKVDTLAQKEHIVMVKNDTRNTPKPEKTLLKAAGATGKNVGKDDLTENYQDLLLTTNLKEVKQLFIAELLAKLTQVMNHLDLSGTIILQVITSVYTQLFNSKKYRPYLAFFHTDTRNIYAFQALCVKLIPHAIEDCIKTKPHIKSWSRDGKQYLIDDCMKVLGEHLPDFKFPVVPDNYKAPTVSKTKKASKTIDVVVAV